MINSSRPRPSLLPPFFPPPHLITTRNAHGAEEAEGLGTRLCLRGCLFFFVRECENVCSCMRAFVCVSLSAYVHTEECALFRSS